ncbi:hypothetical protein JOB18_042266 [Solea senegalensis]|uniref:Uncharacterized protein n=1 Tax=Solea senegalensis TaxID=28829 RepID=A0AAV6PUK3_SOLSE|nr:hypothetical protein JOB18_042266 [Solea senegalensis]
MKGEGRARPNANIHFVRPEEPAPNTDNQQLPHKVFHGGFSDSATSVGLPVFHGDNSARRRRGQLVETEASLETCTCTC